MEVLQWS
jgi:hypothetical protein